MSDKKTLEVKSFFDGYASDFESIYGCSKRSAWDKIADKWFRKSMMGRFKHSLEYAENPEIETILDVGCGPGHYLHAFLEMGKRVTGIDIAKNMIELSAKKNTDNLKSGKLILIAEEYLAHKFENPFDASCLMGFFDYIEYPEKTIEKLKRDTTKEFWMSFPKRNHILTWQRKIRYAMRNCPLFFYTRDQIESILKSQKINNYSIIDLDRDFFVRVVNY